MPHPTALPSVPASTDSFLGYARALQARGQWADAIPQFELARTHRPETVLPATLGIAFSYRKLRDFENAHREYLRLAELAVSSGGVPYLLDADLGLAKLLIDTGRLPEAAAALDRLIVRTREVGDHRLLSKALLDRSAVAGMQDDIGSAIRFAYDALPLAENDYERDAILLNLGEAFRLIGDAEQAYRLALTVQHSPHQNLRASAGALAIHLSIDRKQQLPFVRHRAWLMAQGTPSATDPDVCAALERGERTFRGEAVDPFVPRPVTDEDAATMQHIARNLYDRCVAILKSA